MTTFVEWFEEQTGHSAPELELEHAFVIAVCRIETAAAQNADDPIASVSNAGAHRSRIATKAMLGSLGYTPAQTRVMQRLLAGSAGIWPGLIRLYVQREALTRSHRDYVTRQVRLFKTCARAA